jgi:UDP-N-acetylglucosamine--N-acetylmuramyl-(pentapeptide) pyrophosphoryl-undecaprenol N-acetylglucosamine transferase
MIKGMAASYKILSQFKPEVILFTGGYVAGPMAVVRGRTPSLLFVPDIEPGLALRFLIFTTSRIAIICQQSRDYIRRKKSLVETGYPIRAELKDWDRAKGRTHLTLKDELPVVLIAGGSSGARSINKATLKCLPELLKICQIVHISGKLDWPEVEKYQSELPAEIKQRYHPFSYLHEMGAALASADLVVSRAGGSTLGEYPYFGLPAILIPYPHAWRYQKVNAAYLQNQGAANILWDEDLDSRLFSSVIDLLNNPSQMEKMRTAMLSLRIPDAAEKLAAQVLQMARPRGGKA